MFELNNTKGFGVTKSPFNKVKLELGILLCLGLVMLVFCLTTKFALLWQLLFLTSYAIFTIVFIVFRTRKIARAHSNDSQ